MQWQGDGELESDGIELGTAAVIFSKLETKMKDHTFDRPVGDPSLWLKRRAEIERRVYDGPQPERHSPATRVEEERAFFELLYGKRLPRTSFESAFLRFMGGIRDEPTQKWVTCKTCKTDFKTSGYPARDPTKPPLYPDVCIACGEEMSAGLRTIPRGSFIRPVCNDQGVISFDKRQ
jgi:hypothetical protein